jgi:hypothetical protein
MPVMLHARNKKIAIPYLINSKKYKIIKFSIEFVNVKRRRFSVPAVKVPIVGFGL